VTRKTDQYCVSKSVMGRDDEKMRRLKVVGRRESLGTSEVKDGNPSW
jgi:hypothetical protein